jgi:hypothetical protein
MRNMDELKELSVYNTLGQVVLTKRETGNQIILDFSSNNLAQGIYTLQIYFPSTGHKEIKKLIYAK